MTNNDGFSVAELAELAGVSIPTIRFLRRAHMTPRAVFLGNKMLFPRAEAEAWVAAEGYKTRPTLSETIF